MTVSQILQKKTNKDSCSRPDQLNFLVLESGPVFLKKRKYKNIQNCHSGAERYSVSYSKDKIYKLKLIFSSKSDFI